MATLKKQASVEEKDRGILQKRIRASHPQQLERNVREMCPKCWAKDCFLLPVTSAGGDCPYFNRQPKQL